MQNNGLFSKEAMDKLRSPEKLDTLLEVTNPIGWMALASMVVMVISVLIWSVFGAMLVKVEGVGMLLDSAGIYSVTPITGGRVDKVHVRTGMRVQKGDLLAVLEQPDQTVATNLARSEMYLSTNELEAFARVSQYDANLYRQDISSYVFSEYDGIVDEISVAAGSVVNQGSSICTIRKDQEMEELKGVLYVPVINGKRVEPGMTIQLAPNGIDVSEDGSLIGVVRSVSMYPVSGNAIYNRLGNMQLTEWILNKADNAVMEVSFDLVKDENSESGYLWSSVVGKHKEITPGSVCTGFIIVESKPPIEKVFYKFSQWLRSR